MCHCNEFLDSDPSDTIPIAHAQLEHLVKHGPIFSLEKVLTVLHLVEVTLDLNVELSEVTGKLLLKLFSNAYGNINTSLLIWFSNQCTERQTTGSVNLYLKCSLIDKPSNSYGNIYRFYRPSPSLGRIVQMSDFANLFI